MHHLYAAAPLVFGLGVIGILYTMAAWWTDVVREAEFQGHHSRVVQISHRYGMILFIASEVMFFVAWFWIFFEMALFHGHRTLSSIDDVRTAWATWPPKGVETVPPWQLPLINTLTLLLSGTTVTWAHHALQTGDRRGAKIGLTLTILLGVMFTAIQAYEYNHIFTHKYFFSEEAANAGTSSTPLGGQVAQAWATPTVALASGVSARWPWKRDISKKIQNQATKNITSEAMNITMP